MSERGKGKEGRKEGRKKSQKSLQSRLQCSKDCSQHTSWQRSITDEQRGLESVKDKTFYCSTGKSSLMIRPKRFLQRLYDYRHVALIFVFILKY